MAPSTNRTLLSAQKCNLTRVRMNYLRLPLLVHAKDESAQCEREVKLARVRGAQKALYAEDLSRCVVDLGQRSQSVYFP